MTSATTSYETSELVFGQEGSAKYEEAEEDSSFNNSPNCDSPIYQLCTPKRRISQHPLLNSASPMRSRILKDSIDTSSLSLVKIIQEQQYYGESSHVQLRKSKNIMTHRNRRQLNRTNENIMQLYKECGEQNNNTTQSQLSTTNTNTTTTVSSYNSLADKSSLTEVIPRKKVSYNSNYFRKKKKKVQSMSVVRSLAAVTGTGAVSDDIQLLNKQFLFDNTKPYISAQAWAIIDQSTGHLLLGRLEAERRQVASLTKIMTAFVVFDILLRMKINEHETLVRILPSTCQLTGTTANLLANDSLSVWELLYAMMLPSGNDAAHSLAIYFGLLTLSQKNSEFAPIVKNLVSIQNGNESSLSISEENTDVIIKFIQLFANYNLGLAEFYKLMNREAMFMGLKNSNFCSAHGMHHDLNYSSAMDIATISYHCMKHVKFRQIVKTQKYNCESRTLVGHLYSWQNTNKLLDQGYSGLKTGITPTAGPCLAASIVKNDFKLIIVILCSKSMEQRWIEVPKLVQWATNKITKIKESDLKPSLKKKLLNKLVHI